MSAHRFRRWGVSVWRLFVGARFVGIGHQTAVRARIATPSPAMEPVSDARARFTAAVDQYGLTPADLRRIRRTHTLRFYGRVGAACFALSFSVTSAYLTFGGFVALLAVLLALLFLAASVQSSLRVWQIRGGRLATLGEWVRSPAVWFPPFWERS